MSFFKEGACSPERGIQGYVVHGEQVGPFLHDVAVQLQQDVGLLLINLKKCRRQATRKSRKDQEESGVARRKKIAEMFDTHP